MDKQEKKTMAILLIFIVIMGGMIFYLDSVKGEDLRQKNIDRKEYLKETPPEDLNVWGKIEKWFYELPSAPSA